MHRLHAIFAALLLLTSASHAQVEPGQTFTGRIMEVTDGDTYDVRRSIGGTATIRLYGIDGEPS